MPDLATQDPTQPPKKLSKFEQGLFEKTLADLEKEQQEDLAKLEAKKAQVTEAAQPKPMAAGGAFPDQGPDVAVPPPPAVPPSASTTQNVLESTARIAGPIAGSIGAQSLAAETAAAATAISPPLGAAVYTGAAILGAGLGGAGTSLTLDAARKGLGLPGAPDSFDDWVHGASAAGMEEAYNETWSQGIGSVMTRLAPWRRFMTTESAEWMKEHGRRLREVYESIAQHPIMEDTRKWYSPYRLFTSAETELDKSWVVKNLEEEGLDPRTARNVAVTNGLLPSKIPNSTFRKFEGVMATSALTPDALYNTNRSILARASLIEDLGIKYADVLPREELGRAIHGALNDEFKLLTAARDEAMHGIEMNIWNNSSLQLNPKALTVAQQIDYSKLKNLANRRNPDSAATKLINQLNTGSTFGQGQVIRNSLNEIAQNLDANDKERKLAAWYIERLDQATEKGLPSVPRQMYRKWSDADNEIYSKQYKSAYVHGLFHQVEPVAKEFADTIIDLGDAQSLKRLEIAVKDTPNGQQIIDSVRGHIKNSAISGAVDMGEVINPKKLPKILGQWDAGYTKEFLNATLGREYGDNLRKYTKVMNLIDDTAASTSQALSWGRVMTYGTLTTSLANFLGLANYTQTGFAGVGTLAITMFAPEVVNKILSSKTASRFMLKAAENVAKGYAPKYTTRLAVRALNEVGLSPEELLRKYGLLAPDEIARRQKELTDAGAAGMARAVGVQSPTTTSPPTTTLPPAYVGTTTRE